MMLCCCVGFVMILGALGGLCYLFLGCLMITSFLFTWSWLVVWVCLFVVLRVWCFVVRFWIEIGRHFSETGGLGEFFA